MNPLASAGIAVWPRGLTLQGGSPEQDCDTGDAVRGGRRGEGGGVPESQSLRPVVWQLAWEPWGLLGKSQEERTG